MGVEHDAAGTGNNQITCADYTQEENVATEITIASIDAVLQGKNACQPINSAISTTRTSKIPVKAWSWRDWCLNSIEYDKLHRVHIFLVRLASFSGNFAPCFFFKLGKKCITIGRGINLSKIDAINAR